MRRSIMLALMMAASTTITTSLGQAQDACEGLGVVGFLQRLFDADELREKAVLDFCEEYGQALSAIDKLQHDLETVERRLPPRGSVLIVDEASGCPEGTSWIPFDEASGKVVIGQGQGTLKIQDQPPVALTPRAYRHEGGKEEYPLETAHTPRHAHNVNLTANEDGSIFHQAERITKTYKKEEEVKIVENHNRQNKTEFVISVGMVPTFAPIFSGAHHDKNYGQHQHMVGGITEEFGKGTPHPNMPPYIALYFCKYEG